MSESENIAEIRRAVQALCADFPGAYWREKDSARAYPGEDPASVKPPEAVAEQLISLIGEQFASGYRESINHRA